MVSRRFATLSLAPILIVTASFVMTRWCRAPLETTAVANEFSPLPDEIVDRPPAVRVAAGVASQCDALAGMLRVRLGGSCHVMSRPPFVVAGDLSSKELEYWYDRTIVPASAAMQNEYFDASPQAPIQLFLFRNEDAYNNYTQLLFGDRHVSVYGYFKPEQRAVLVNLATGSGSLVHELTHALMHDDFPHAPHWFQEGLASLHEQAGVERVDQDLRLLGRLNWRYERLALAIRAGELPELSTLLTSNRLRGQSELLDYARARYLCLFLQEHGWLDDFYREFRAQVQADPTGEASLLRSTPFDSLEELDHAFQSWALTLQPLDR